MNYKDIILKVLNFLYPDYFLDDLLERTRGVLPEHKSFLNLNIPKYGDVQATTLSNYGDLNTRGIIHSLKYIGDNRAIELAARALHDYILESLSELLPINNNIIILPIPISKSRLKERGFNQLHEVLQCLCKFSPELSEYVNFNILIKNRDTLPQTHLSRKRRLTNLKGTFSIKDRSKLFNKHVILIDDVITTGTTVSEASKEILQSGASKVDVVAIAGSI